MVNQKLELFINAAYYRNFTKAAEVSHVTQATMSRQIKALEQEIGAPLFLRTQYGVTLTEPGKYLYDRATSYIEQYDDIIEGCRKSSALPFSKLRLGTGPYEHLLMYKPLQLLLDRFPFVQYNYMSYTYKILGSRYKNRSIDFGFCLKQCIDMVGGLDYAVIYSEPWKVVAHRDHPFWNLPTGDRRSLRGQRIATNYRNDFEPVEAYCVSHGFRPAEYVEANFLHAQIVLLRTKSCIALLPPFAAAALPEDIRMEDILEDPLAPQFVAAYDPNNPNPGNALFLEICRECFPQSQP
ncbi:MAG: LysR family transcriptional regulator [Clostridiaceae bacterium]|nr:LysR family transcriptional regulator [Clostridiaceae bacterium]